MFYILDQRHCCSWVILNLELNEYVDCLKKRYLFKLIPGNHLRIRYKKFVFNRLIWISNKNVSKLNHFIVMKPETRDIYLQKLLKKNIFKHTKNIRQIHKAGIYVFLKKINRMIIIFRFFRSRIGLEKKGKLTNQVLTSAAYEVQYTWWRQKLNSANDSFPRILFIMQLSFTKNIFFRGSILICTMDFWKILKFFVNTIKNIVLLII
ncbi:hypothetical protein BpHYR1_054135 [Brachionus plicatilis]|uniref:Uncharacterized protein n=1 Tax=Brachionus plicatilis TaxID=10195 RepID=A0A3M7S924_BRAPC|nr:hypothetical protein BpHYR1_054135 [Brachionus plicatilis]